MLVTVVIPCYNVEHYIADCLQSLTRQTHPHLQIICVDNSSTDGTLSLLRNISANNQQLITVLEESQKGAPHARNRGLSEAKGTYIQFLDADDLLEPDKIAHQVKLITEKSFPDIVAADYHRMAVDGTKKIYKVNHHDYWLALLYTQLGITSANIFKTSTVRAAGGFDVSLKSSQEYALMFQMMRIGATLVHDSTSLTVVRDRKGGSIMQQNAAENMERYLSLRIAIIKHLENKISKADMSPYYQALFDAMRVLYKHNKSLALQSYKAHLKTFKPSASITTTRSYALLFKIFGFEGTEKIKSFIG